MIAENAFLRVVATLQIGETSKAQNVFHMSHVTGTSQSDEDVVEAAGEWCVDFYTTMQSAIVEDVSLEKVEVFVRESSEWQPVGVASPAWDGANVGERLPAGIAMLLKAYKERTGHTDKKYIAGLSDGQIEADNWGVATRGYGDDAIAYWVTEQTLTNAVKLIGIHYNTVTEGAKSYTGGSVGLIAAYQRRRKPGVGLT